VGDAVSQDSTTARKVEFDTSDERLTDENGQLRQLIHDTHFKLDLILAEVQTLRRLYEGHEDRVADLERRVFAQPTKRKARK
jgi:hypothetical protein